MLDGITSHPFISLGLIVVGIALVCAFIALLRGVFRLMVNTIILTLSLAAGYWVWLKTPGWGELVFRDPPAWVPYILPLIVAIACSVFLRKAFKILLFPFSAFHHKPESSGGRYFSVGMSLIPTAMLCLIAFLLIRHLGTLRLVENPDTRAISVLWKDVIDRYIPAAWLQRIDPLTDPLRLTLAQWLSLASESHIPRAIPVSDPQALDSQLVADPKWKELLDQGRYAEMLRSREIEQALKDPRVKKVLEELRMQMNP
jgi:hypothetical protein